MKPPIFPTFFADQAACVTELKENLILRCFRCRFSIKQLVSWFDVLNEKSVNDSN